jgi:hypothetical protein
MRQRYDTVALINELKKERRNALLLSAVGLMILAGLITAYFLVFGTSEMPAVPPSPAAATTPANAPTPTKTAPTPSKPATPPASATASVALSLSKKGQLWIDNNPLGPTTTHEAQLPPGKHTLKAKIGPKTLMVSLTVKEGEKYTVSFDPKKKKPEVKKEP